MTYKAVILDMDGVIFDSEQLYLTAWRELGEKYDFPGAEDTVRACAGTTAEKTMEIVVQRYGPDFPFLQYSKEAMEIFFSHCPGGKLPMKPGVESLLSSLKRRGLKVALATSAAREAVEKELEAAGIRRYFDAVICGDMVENSKPAPDIYLRACEQVGVEPRYGVAIEDSPNGVRSAAAAGLPVIMVPDLVPADDEMRELAWVVLEDLTEAEIWLEYESRPCAGGSCDR